MNSDGVKWCIGVWFATLLGKDELNSAHGIDFTAKIVPGWHILV